MISFDNIGLVGWNGKRNVGDDAMTAVIINYILQKYNSDTKFQLLADSACLAKYTSSEEIVQGFSNYNFSQNIRGLRRWLTPMIFDRRLSKQCPVILIGGGSIFHMTSHSKRLLKLVLATRKSHPQTLIGAISVSLGPFKNQIEREAAKKVFQELDFIATRDIRSWEVLKSLEVQTPSAEAMDIALLLPELLPESITLKNQTQNPLSIGVALRQGHTPTNLMESLDKSLNYLQSIDSKLEVNLLNFSDVDEPYSRQLQESLQFADRVKFHPYTDSPSQMYNKIASCSLVLATRLHAAVISYTMETNFIVFAYHQKCVDFARIVEIDDNLIIPIQELSADLLTDRIMSLKLESLTLNAKFPIRQAKQNAYRNFQFLDKIY